MKVIQTKTASAKPATSTMSATIAKKEAPFFAKGGEPDFFHSRTTEQPFFNKSTIIPTSIQAKLSVGKPNDRYEQEADSMADKVVQRMSKTAPDIQKTEEPLIDKVTPVVQLKCAECEQEEKVQEKEQDNKEEEQVQRKAIFDSNEEMPVQSKAIDTPVPGIQAKCAECEKEDEMEEQSAGKEEEEVQRKAIFESNEEMPVQSKAIDTAVPGIQAKCAECEKDEMEEQGAGKEEEEVQRKAIFESNEEMSVQSKEMDTAVPAIQAKCAECEKEEKEETVQEEDAGKEIEEQLQRRPVLENNEEKRVQLKPEQSKENKTEIKTPITQESLHAVQKKTQQIAPVSAPVTIQAEQTGEMDEEKKEDKESGEVLQKKPVFETNEQATPSIEQRLSASKSGGQSLPGDARTNMESNFGADFSQVKIHTNNTAVQLSRDLGAHAFTHGNNIYFNQGKYDPASNEGKRLLAHELTHTIQQKSSGNVQRSAVPAIQKDGPDITLVRNDVNRRGNASYNNLVRNFNNGISLFQNWYFSKDEGDQSFYNEAFTVIREAASQVTVITSPIGSRLAGVFGAGAASLSVMRTGFITSLTNVIGSFTSTMNTSMIDHTASIIEGNDSPGWATVMQRFEANTNWQEILTNDGLPAADITTLQQHLLSQLMFIYRRWELNQHSEAYRGIYSMSDPNLTQMRASAEADARNLIAHPRINLGDIILSLPDQTILDAQRTPAIKDVITIGQASLGVPIYPGLGVGINGSLKAGYDVGASFGPIQLKHLQFGFSYSQTPIMFSLMSGLMLINGLAGLRTISSIYSTRFRVTGELDASAKVWTKLFVKAALGIGLEVGLPNIISANVAGIEGTLEARFGAELNALFAAPMDIIIDRGNMSFSHAQSLKIGTSVGFKLLGGIRAHFLTLDWEKQWDILNWQWGKKWEFNSNMNLIYANGIQGDPEKTVNVQNVIHSVSELLDLGNQLMNATSPASAANGAGGGGTGGAPPPAMPNPSGPLDLNWPKPASANYPILYLTVRGETRTQRQLRDLYEGGDTRHIEAFHPHEKKFLPANEAELGIDPEFQTFIGKDVGPLEEGASTPGGDRMNRLVRHYGIPPSQMQGDHVYEIQLGGEDRVENMWPLDAGLNTSGGSALNQAIVTEPSTGHTFRISFLKTVMRNHGHVTYMFIIRAVR